MISQVSDSALVFVRHGHIRVCKSKGDGWVLLVNLNKHTSHTVYADSKEQRDEYITRIRLYAAIIE